MNEKTVACILAVMMAASVTAGCGSSSSTAETTAVETETAAETGAESEAVTEAATEENSDTIANPWTDTDAQGLVDTLGLSFNEPEGAQDPVYRMCESEGIAEMQYTDEAGTEICARAKMTGEEEDISGMNYTWTDTEDVEIGYSGGKFMQAQDGDSTVEVVTWFDAVPGISYAVSAVGTDLDGFDLLGIAAEVYVPAQGEAYSDDYIAVCGIYTSDYDQSTVTIGEDGLAEIGLTRLAELEGTSSDLEDGILTLHVTDPADGEMTLTFDPASGELTVTESSWEYLNAGDSFTGFVKG